MRFSLSLFCIIFTISACQSDNDKSEKEKSISNGKKSHFIVKDNDNKIIQTYSKDEAYEFDIRTDYVYSKVDSLKKKIIKNEYQDSVIVDSVVYSYKITDTLKKKLSVRYTKGKVLSKTSTIDILKNNKLIGRNVYISSYNKYKGYSDTIRFISTYNYLEDKLNSKEEQGKYMHTSENFYYENDLLKRKVLLDMLEQDTLSTVDFFSKDGDIFKSVVTDNKAQTVLTSIYNKDGFLTESFWQGTNNEPDTVIVKFIDHENKVEYYWNGDFYPSFRLVLED